MKKFTACICCAALVLSMAAANITAYAAQADNAAGAAVEQQESKDDGIPRGEFTVRYSWFDGSATIIGVNEKVYARNHPEYATNHKLIFPEKIDSEDEKGTVDVTGIGFPYGGSGWKNGIDSCTFETVVIPNTVKSIGGYTFNDIKSLKYVEFESGTKIDNYYRGGISFSGCINLKRIGVNGSDKLPSVGSGQCSLPSSCFEGCSSLQSITIPEGITEIQIDAFKDCTSLKQVSIPSTIRDIDMGVFSNCSNLTSVKFGLNKNGKSKLSSLGDYGFIGGWAGVFEGCKKLEKIDLPLSEGDCDIGDRCFKNSGLKGVNIPASVKKIGTEAFAGTKLEENALKTPKGEAYGIAFFGKSTAIHEDAFKLVSKEYKDGEGYVDTSTEIKPIVACYKNSGADVFAYSHDFGDCVYLGDWDPYKITYTGDINGDGKPAATDDLVAFIRYMNGNTKNVNEDQLDVDGDGQKATTRDLVRLIKIMNS